jgi:hypothetical protein
MLIKYIIPILLFPLLFGANKKELKNNPTIIEFELPTEILYVERAQYIPDHHNTATLFQTGEINTASFRSGAALKAFNSKTGIVRVIFETSEGSLRDPEVSFDGKKIIFSLRKSIKEDYHIAEINSDGSGFHWLTNAKSVSDLDPLYLPDGGIIFSSSRETKYCMCNRHIMANLFRMDGDGANINQLGYSTLFEGHSALLNDGRIVYDRWEYIDRNFGDAQGLWTVFPDGTKQSVYYGNNTNSPGGIIDPRAIPGSNHLLCIFSSCHDRPWGALAVIDRSKGVDGKEAVVKIWPEEAYDMIGKGNWDQFMQINTRYEDPFPIDENHFLVSKLIQDTGTEGADEKMGIYLVDMNGTLKLIHKDSKSCFDPMPLAPRFKPPALPAKRVWADVPGFFYIQNVYEGTHMEGVEPGSIKFVRIIESPPKQTWTQPSWGGQGQQAPGVNWHGFENKKILGEVPVEVDGSAYFEVPHSSFVYFQLLDENKKMIHSMRSGTMVQPGETNGCIGCHENRLSVPVNQSRMAIALRKAPHKMNGWKGEARKFNYATEIQPIFDMHCVRCHDFGGKAGNKLILAGDKNTYFNASYIDLNLKKMINCVGGGTSEIQNAYSWGSNASRLSEVLEGKHFNTQLSKDELERIYTWIDINGPYYPEYESAYPNNLAGRSPLTDEELKRIEELSGIKFKDLSGFTRKLGPQISFDRPAISPLLKSVENQDAKQEIIALLELGKQRLEEKPRADMAGFVPCIDHQNKLELYNANRKKRVNIMEMIQKGEKVYDQK